MNKKNEILLKKKIYLRKINNKYIYKTKFDKKTKSSHTEKLPTVKILATVNSPTEQKNQISRRSCGRSMEILGKQIKVQTRSSTLVKFTR